MKNTTINEEAKFTQAYLILNEVFNAITHGIGFSLSIAGLVILLFKGLRNNSALEVVCYSIYGSTLIILYLCSTLYHSLIFTRVRKIFRVFDHSSIFLLIAGTYTPYCLIIIGGTLGWTIFFIIWTIAILGIIYKVFWIDKYNKFSTLLYIASGWLCIIAAKPMIQGLGIKGALLLLIGGLSFTVGSIFYEMKNVRFMHVLWHIFVFIGTLLMYFSILFYV
ncbi:MAG: hemolysin III family protein [Clostridiales bacterium]|uniref:PAQR family membrane homeostasis protein TrhA n=1 Tax=Clostridium sp. N3C TaxID=1776758 RepID=UPI00092DF9DF|nr:hemolysin III family protein [Clostridium sp. N3C]NLZ50002.1 hemolysin III family protein [Clostridiales bacterium]SCN25879.1 hemolysin [Clostridium sp. N3C]